MTLKRQTQRPHPHRLRSPVIQGEKELLYQAENLRRALAVLRRNRGCGRVFAGRLLKDLRCFREQVRSHFVSEEKVLFPFVRRHIPKAECATFVLGAEHADFRRDLSALEKMVARFADGPSAKVSWTEAGPVYETGLNLIYFLKHHIRHETREVHRLIERDLRASEKALLQKLLLHPA